MLIFWFFFIHLSSNIYSIPPQMKNFLISLTIIVLSFSLTSFLLESHHVNYNQQNDKPNKLYASKSNNNTLIFNLNLFPNINDITNSLEDWTSYYNKNIKLYDNYTALNSEGLLITKHLFLSKLTSGNYIPLKLLTNSNIYQLYKINYNIDNDIQRQIKKDAIVAYSNFKHEGLKFPDSKFNNSLNKDITILSYWNNDYSAFKNDLKELGYLYNRYKNTKDVSFITISEDIAKFKKTGIPILKPTISNFKPKTFPSYVIINSEGNIEKIVNDVDSLTDILDTLKDKDNILDLSKNEV